MVGVGSGKGNCFDSVQSFHETFIVKSIEPIEMMQLENPILANDDDDIPQ